MGIDKGIVEQVRHLLRPLSNRIANIVSRATVQRTNDKGKLQRVQVGALVDETIEDVEHHQPYGFSSIPLDGAEAIAVFPNGDRSHPIAVVVSDRRHRPTGRQAGEVCLYTDEGDVVRLGRGHIISLETDGEVRLGSASASGAVVVQQALDLFVQALTNAVNSTALSTAPMAPGKAALATFLTALTTGVCLPAPPIPGLAGGWTAGTTKTKAE